MRCVVEPGRSLNLFRLAILATVSVTVVGCSSDTQRFKANPFGGRTQASNEVTGSVAQPQQHTRIQSQPLPPPTAAAPSTRPAMVGQAGGSPGMGSYQPGRAEVTGSVPAPARVAAAPAPRSAWTRDGGTFITIQRGDTIDGLVSRYGVPADAIAEANNLPNGSALKPGQHLVIPKYEATGSTSPRVASVSPHQPAPSIGAPQTTGQHVHVIQPGETLMKLSRQYHKPLAEIAKANNIPPATMVKVGDRIVIPGVRGQQQAAVAPSKPPVAVAAAKVPATVMAQQHPAPAPVTKVASVPAAPVAAAPTAAMVTPAAHNPEPSKVKTDVTAAMPSFRWPVRGRVIAGFGPKSNGAQNDGINVSVPEGTPIKAAEDGVVAYAGNELKTYGNLVLVRHANGFVTAYAHASEIMVKRDDPVKRGQIIAKAGQTGSVAAPQLHFEIRKGSTPVDPAPFLDKGGNG